MAFRVLVVLGSLLVCLHAAEPNLITQPQPGQEYVFVQTSDTAGARPVVRKEKEEIAERETAHKLPPTLTFLLQEEASREKREAAKAPSVAPAGAIKLDPLKLIEKYKAELATSTTTTTTKKPAVTKSKIAAASANRRKAPKLAAPSPAPRTKKEAKPEDAPTTASSIVLTTPNAPELKASSTENKKSRIHIKKGPNGQDYEYEYVYYYYDDDDETKDKTDSSKENAITPEPAKAEKPNQNSAEKSSAKAEPASNEVVPASKITSKNSKGRQLDEEESNVDTERLPANTRFPPRGRNLATSPAPPEPTTEEAKTPRSRSRSRGKTTSAPVETDSTSEETQRGRTRANVRRPSLELVDSASFNTHSGTAGAEPPIGGPSFPSDLPAGPVRFLGATPNERMDLQEPASKASEAPTSTEHLVEAGETTTLMSAMDKVALDLYAVVQGTQKLSGEDSEETSTSSEEETTTLFDTTPEATTDAVTTETATPSTTTTTTTTTTPAPSTTAAPEAGSPFGRGRYRGRQSARRTSPSGSASTTESTSKSSDNGSASRPKSRFGNRPSFGSSRSRTRTTAEPSAESEVSKEEAKPVSHSKPSLSRNRFGGARTRATTAAPSGEESQSSTTASSRPSLPRARPAFNGARRRGGSTTAAPGDSNEQVDGSGEASSTTARSRVRPGSNGLVRPLRPGPRINNIGRLGKPGASSTTAAPEASQEVSSAEDVNTNAPEESGEKVSETTPAPTQDTNPLNRLRNRARLTVSARPKTAASAPVPVRRVNPLLGRRKIEPSSTEAPTQESAESNETVQEVASGEEVDTESIVPSSSTTEEPRGLNKLLAGRRRLGSRQPGTLN